MQSVKPRQGCSDDVIVFIALYHLSAQLITMPNMSMLRQYISRLTRHMPLACELREVNQYPCAYPSQRGMIRNI